MSHLEYRTEPFQQGRAFGDAGPFEVIPGTADFAVDPASHDLCGITDLDKVPRNTSGRVSFSANFLIIRAVDPAKRNGRLFLDMANRGGPRLLRNTNVQLPPPLGTPTDATDDGWLLQRGYSILSCGWQHDAPSYPGALRAEIPEALIDGQRIRGPVSCQLEAFAPTEVVAIGHYGHRHYQVADVSREAQLTVRDYADALPIIVPRDRWEFIYAEAGAPVAGPHSVHFHDGFRPGKLYELTYEAEGAVPTGLGLVGVRDLLSFLRYGKKEDGNPCAGEFSHIYGFGASQPAGVLRVMGQLNLFQDHEGRPVLDGFIAHGAGAFKSEVNWRFGQMSPFGPRTTGFVPPFDARPPAGGHMPKAIYTNAGPDYWDLYTALCHVRPDGSADLALSENERFFYLAGQPHVRGAIADVSGTDMITHPVNTIDFGPFMRAAVVNLDRWVSENVPFPPSRMPTLADGTLVDRSKVTAKVAASTGVTAPLHPAEPRVLDFGPMMDHHIATRGPVQLEAYAALICDVNADGNDIAGLQHPEVSEPLATYAPWNVQAAGSGAPGEGAVLVGSMLPFAFDPSGRRDGDTRLAIAERYRSRTEYQERVRAVTQALISEGMVLPDDEELIVEAAGQRWDRVVSSVHAAA